jgi:hypothetical protein
MLGWVNLANGHVVTSFRIGNIVGAALFKTASNAVVITSERKILLLTVRTWRFIDFTYQLDRQAQAVLQLTRSILQTKVNQNP